MGLNVNGGNDSPPSANLRLAAAASGAQFLKRGRHGLRRNVRVGRICGPGARRVWVNGLLPDAWPAG